METEIVLKYEILESDEKLTPADYELLKHAREFTKNSYAPYSNFFVAASARLKNGEIISGTNQENASYPVGICAERVLLSTISAIYPNVGIESIAISYNNINGNSDKPISPCGICRQSLSEYEERVGASIRIIMSGMEGKIIVVENAAILLPFKFGSDDMK